MDEPVFRFRDAVFRMAFWLFALLAVRFCLLFSLQSSVLPAFAAMEEETPEDEFVMEVISVAYPAKEQKKVYIYHTHTDEAYEMDAENKYRQTEKWRTADQNYNVVRVGEELASCLRSAGILVWHDTTDYEMPRLSTAYSRSLEGLKAAAQEGYDLYIDLHRDSYSKGNGANTVSVDGRSTARLLFLIGQGTGSSLEDKPDWETNQKTAEIISNALNDRADGLSRGVKLKSGRYNQQAAVPCILIEVGNNLNTLPEALNAMEPLAYAICLYFDGAQ